MKKLRVWAEGPVVQVTAWLLEQDILVLTEYTSDENLYLIIEGDKEHKLPQIILGHTSGCHHESYLDLEEINANEMS